MYSRSIRFNRWLTRNADTIEICILFWAVLSLIFFCLISSNIVKSIDADRCETISEVAEVETKYDKKVGCFVNTGSGWIPLAAWERKGNGR